jgi:hypothetical protein
MVPAPASTMAKSSAKARLSSAAQAARDLVAQAEAASLELRHLAVGLHRGGQVPGVPCAVAVHGPGRGLLGGGVRGQRVQRRGGIETRRRHQCVLRKGRQHRQLLALVARARRQWRELRRARGQAAQARLHAEGRAHGGVEVELAHGCQESREGWGCRG